MEPVVVKVSVGAADGREKSLGTAWIHNDGQSQLVKGGCGLITDKEVWPILDVRYPCVAINDGSASAREFEF